MKGIIYHITNKINGKTYIGKTTNLKHRLECHFNDLKNGKHHSHKLQRAYDKYGIDNFVVTYTEVECEDDKALSKLEVDEIERYDSYVSGYNETLGGDGHATVFNFNQAVIIHAIASQYSGVNRTIARYFNCDHTVVDDIAKNQLYDDESYDLSDYASLVDKLGLSDDNLKENYEKHNDRKLSREQCLEMLAVITHKTGYDKIICSIMGVTNPTTTRLKKGLIYKEYIADFNSLSKEEQLALCNQVFKKYNLAEEKNRRKRAGTKNALTQEQVDYIMENKDKKTRVQIGADLGISADRVGGVILGKYYKDLVENYYNCHV